jgi:hypothetical protein
MKASHFRPLRRTLHPSDKRKVTYGSLLLPKEVKNEGRSGDVYENKGSHDKLPEVVSGIYAQLKLKLSEFSGLTATFCRT